METDKPQYVLAIETATAKGSLSLLKYGTEIASWIGGPESPMSSSLLPQISLLLDQAQITLDDVNILAISVGPGSFTGVRIGIASAMGLQMAKKIPTVSVTLPHALALAAIRGEGVTKVITLIQSGRGESYWQEFNVEGTQVTPVGEVISSQNDELADMLLTNKAYCIAANGLKAESIAQIESRAGKHVNMADDNLAMLIGVAGIHFYTSVPHDTALTPLYVKSFNAGRQLT
jgi:tRNA threonylcarbamoyl adenosine modification protein YeaZ